ncbi:MAG: hypothetical protein AAFP82_10410, partial [Bacteroidota bacterium]
SYQKYSVMNSDQMKSSSSGELLKTEKKLDGILEMSDLPSGQYQLLFVSNNKSTHFIVHKIE